MSCATTTNETAKTQSKLISTAFGETAVNKKEKDKQPVADSKAILDSILPPVIANKPTDKPMTRFDVSADNLPLDKFLMGLVDNTSFNLLVDSGLTQPVTLHLKNVTIQDVLAVLQKTHDIDVRQQGNIYYIGGSKLQTAVYPLDYLNVEREGRSTTQVSSGQILNGNMQGQGQQNGQGAAGGMGAMGGMGGMGGQNVMTLNSSNIETKSKTDLWKEVQDALDAIVGQDQDSMVIVSPQTGTVLVKARPIIQRQVADYLGVAQANLGRQVILEAKILEVTLNDSFQAGIDWSQVTVNGAGNLIAVGQLGQTLDTPIEQNPINGAFNLRWESDPNSVDPFSATVSLLEQQGNVQVLSSPRISTINNQKAVIKVGTDEFYVTNVQTNIAGGLNQVAAPNVTLTPFFSGIALDVTPQVSSDSKITLHIHPSVSEVSDQTKDISIGEQSLTLPLALSSVRESDSIIKLNSGQVVVIGGLMQNQLVENDAGIPILRSIPGIGSLFNQQREKMVKSELVLLLKATVVDEEQWLKEIKATEQRFKGF
ncbi:MAG: pilus (MSHA type) biogenesis protein MshL [Kangiellaceae bacterium]|nr:pilus (MSHA type) biogenesis protein MshL [Kangiellaceae bacterium]